uniref:Uncharacterized protein n=1 Tax=Oryza meridionalis TaxID=40149 RepID=A0A0E0CCX5_9ORYZ
MASGMDSMREMPLRLRYLRSLSPTSSMWCFLDLFHRPSCTTLEQPVRVIDVAFAMTQKPKETEALHKLAVHHGVHSEVRGLNEAAIEQLVEALLPCVCRLDYPLPEPPVDEKSLLDGLAWREDGKAEEALHQLPVEGVKQAPDVKSRHGARGLVFLLRQ